MVSGRDFIQVVEETFASGLTTTAAWRLFSDARIETATWDGSGALIGAVSGSAVGLFAKADRLELPPIAASDGGEIILGRSAYTLTIGRLNAHQTSVWSTTEPSSEVASFVDELSAAMPSSDRPDPGHYLWSTPSEVPADPAVDLDAPGACDHRDAVTLARLIVSGHLFRSVSELTGVVPARPALGRAISVKGLGGWYLVGHVLAEPVQ